MNKLIQSIEDSIGFISFIAVIVALAASAIFTSMVMASLVWLYGSWSVSLFTLVLTKWGVL